MEQNSIIQMQYKEKYIRPIVTDSMELALESAILSASVVVDSISSVKTAGQEVENFDMSSSGFNTSWEE